MKQIRRMVLAAVLLCLYSGQSWAVDRYVSTTGSDATQCLDSLAPCEHIQFAFDQAGTDDTIKVAQGTYAERVIINKGVSFQGGWKSDFSARFMDPSMTVIDGSFPGGGRPAGFISVADNISISVTIDGFTVKNSGDNLNGGGIAAISHNFGYVSILIINNIILGNTATFGGALYFDTYNSGTLTASIINNILAENTGTSLGGGIYVSSSNSTTRLHVSNTTITHNNAYQGGGVYAYSYPSGYTVFNTKNSIIWGNTASSYGADIYHQGFGFQLDIYMDHSDVGNVFGAGGGSYIDLGGNINTDPLFANVAVHNYHLLAISPCVDAGTNTDPNLATDADFEGDARIVDGIGNGSAIIDMGADEFVADDSEILLLIIPAILNAAKARSAGQK